MTFLRCCILPFPAGESELADCLHTFAVWRTSRKERNQDRGWCLVRRLEQCFWGALRFEGRWCWWWQEGSVEPGAVSGLEMAGCCEAGWSKEGGWCSGRCPVVAGVWVWSRECSLSRAEMTLQWVCVIGTYSCSWWRRIPRREGDRDAEGWGGCPSLTHEAELHPAPTSAHLLPLSPCMFAVFPEVGGVTSVWKSKEFQNFGEQGGPIPASGDRNGPGKEGMWASSRRCPGGWYRSTESSRW